MQAHVSAGAAAKTPSGLKELMVLRGRASIGERSLWDVAADLWSEGRLYVRLGAWSLLPGQPKTHRFPSAPAHLSKIGEELGR